MFQEGEEWNGHPLPAGETGSEYGGSAADHVDDMETLTVHDEDDGITTTEHHRFDALLSRSRAAREAGRHRLGGGGPSEKRSRSSTPSDAGSVSRKQRRHERSPVTPPGGGEVELHPPFDSSAESVTPVDDITFVAVKTEILGLSENAAVDSVDAESGAGPEETAAAAPEPIFAEVESHKTADALFESPVLTATASNVSVTNSDPEIREEEDFPASGSPKTADRPADDSFPPTPTETVKPAFFESDSDTDVAENLPSFELPEDVDEARVARPAGKLDHILKRPVEQPRPRDIEAMVGLASRHSALSLELSKASSAPPPPPPVAMAKPSVLHDALVRPYVNSQPSPQSDVFSNMGSRRPKAPSMVAGQSHLIEALRASPRPMASSSGESAHQKSHSAESDRNFHGMGHHDLGGRRSGREETLGSLLASGPPPGRRDFGRGMAPYSATQQQQRSSGGGGGGAQGDISSLPLTISGNRQILPRPDNVPVQEVGRSNSAMLQQQDRRRIDTVSNQLTSLAAARNAQARASQLRPGNILLKKSTDKPKEKIQILNSKNITKNITKI